MRFTFWTWQARLWLFTNCLLKFALAFVAFNSSVAYASVLGWLILLAAIPAEILYVFWEKRGYLELSEIGVVVSVGAILENVHFNQITELSTRRARWCITLAGGKRIELSSKIDKRTSLWQILEQETGLKFVST